MYVPYTSASHQPITQVVKHCLFFVTASRKQMFSLHPVATEIGAQFKFERTQEKTEPLDVRYPFSLIYHLSYKTGRLQWVHAYTNYDQTLSSMNMHRTANSRHNILDIW